ncbi:MAG: hypothetical protein Q4D98_08620 [Planctomycetia bacterium]|nr:hypothetical protein [Planctomycetia bacterium]
MDYFIGTDEAGYGPNLGPLAVGATLWSVPDGCLPEEMYARLPLVASQPCPGRVPIADSKKLHKQGCWKHLETGLFAALFALKKWDGEPSDADSVYAMLCGPDAKAERTAARCFDTNVSLPREIAVEDARSLGENLSQTLSTNGIELLDIRTELVFPERFNAGVEARNSKGAFLSDTTLGLAAGFWKTVRGRGNVRILCDKHGGRDRYLQVLMDHFPDLPFCVAVEGRQRSEYVCYDGDFTLAVRFQSKGEENLPVALASMAGKYLREVSMEQFNAFWRERLPGIRPTAGYPTDALRFRNAIEPLSPDWEKIWRNR